MVNLFQILQSSVADPEFPDEDAANSQGGGTNLLFGQFFAENCMKMNEI